MCIAKLTVDNISFILRDINFSLLNITLNLLLWDNWAIFLNYFSLIVLFKFIFTFPFDLEKDYAMKVIQKSRLKDDK